MLFSAFRVANPERSNALVWFVVWAEFADRNLLLVDYWAVFGLLVFGLLLPLRPPAGLLT